MAHSKFIVFIHRCIGVLGLLMVGALTTRLFYQHAQIWGWIYVSLVVYLLYSFIRDFFRPKPNWGPYYTIVLIGLWQCWREYSNYKKEQRIEKYGIAFNKTRQKLGVPIIPADWHFEYPGNHGADWEGKEGVFGHASKYVGLDSLHQIEFERDEYNLKVAGDTDRGISISFKYARGKSKDSIFYWYSTKDTSLNISRQQADSIFAAAKVRKDY